MQTRILHYLSSCICLVIVVAPVMGDMTPGSVVIEMETYDKKVSDSNDYGATRSLVGASGGKVLFRVHMGGYTLHSFSVPETKEYALWIRYGAKVDVGAFKYHLDPAEERFVCGHLGLTPVPATQVVARDRHAEYLWACAAVGATGELIGVELRHLQRTEVREAEEGFKPGQKGSSAMPHTRNPITAERLTGLARVRRGNLLAGLEDVALWHERDISHSSVERVILPDSSHLALYVLRTATRLVRDLQVFPDRMLANLDASHGLVFSQPVLLALVAGGLTRDDAYRIVQDDAMRAWTEGVSFRSLLERDERVPLSAAQLDGAFSLERSLRNTAAVFDALDGVAP